MVTYNHSVITCVIVKITIAALSSRRRRFKDRFHDRISQTTGLLHQLRTKTHITETVYFMHFLHYYFLYVRCLHIGCPFSYAGKETTFRHRRARTWSMPTTMPGSDKSDAISQLLIDMLIPLRLPVLPSPRRMHKRIFVVARKWGVLPRTRDIFVFNYTESCGGSFVQRCKCILLGMDVICIFLCPFANLNK